MSRKSPVENGLDPADYPIEDYPYLEPHDWSDWQDESVVNGSGSPWIKNHTRLLMEPKYFNLSFSQRGVLHGIWLYVGMTGRRFPRTHREALRSLSGAPSKPFRRTLDTLILRGFLIPRRIQIRLDKIRVDKTRSEPPIPPAETVIEVEPDPPSGGVSEQAELLILEPCQSGTKEDALLIGFDEIWSDYPHYSGRSKKADARKLWVKLKLAHKLARVREHLEAAKTFPDWRRDGGRYVPGFQVWIRHTDFDDEPRPDLLCNMSDAGRETALNAMRWLEEQNAKG